MLKNIFGRDGYIEKALGTKLFLFVLAAITFICWYTGEEFVGLILLFSLASVIFFFCKDTTPAIAIFIMFYFVFSELDIQLEGREGWIAILLLPVVTGIFNVIRFKPQLKWKGFTFAMVLSIVPWGLQGIGFPNREPLNILLCIGIAVMFILIYLLFASTTRNTYERMVEQFSYLLVAAATVIVAQIITYYARIGGGVEGFLDELENTTLEIGWGGRNNVSTVLSLLMPASFYLATRKGKLSPLFAAYGMLQFFLVLCTNSRGAILFAVAVVPILIIYSIIAAKHKITIAIVYVLITGVFLLLYFRIDTLVETMFNRFLKSGLSASGREKLYTEGIGLFLKYPWFGTGFDYKLPLYVEMGLSASGPTYYHNTFLQIATCLGAVGGVYYLYQYYWRYRIVLTDLSAFKFAMLLGLLMFEGYGFIDTNLFQPIGRIIAMFMILVMEKGLDEEQARPLCFKLFQKLSAKKERNMIAV